MNLLNVFFDEIKQCDIVKIDYEEYKKYDKKIMWNLRDLSNIEHYLVIKFNNANENILSINLISYYETFTFNNRFETIHYYRMPKNFIMENFLNIFLNCWKNFNNSKKIIDNSYNIIYTQNRDFCIWNTIIGYRNSSDSIKTCFIIGENYDELSLYLNMKTPFVKSLSILCANDVSTYKIN